MHKWRTSRLNSFINAFSGIFLNLRKEPNFLIQVLAALLVIAAGFYFRVERFEWLILVLSIGGVLSAEAMNTAVEKICDRFLDAHDPLVKIIKDSAAAAVLILALAAAVAGLIIFLPRIIDLL